MFGFLFAIFTLQLNSVNRPPFEISFVFLGKEEGYSFTLHMPYIDQIKIFESPSRLDISIQPSSEVLLIFR